jgi:hypothetical protein
VLTIVVGTGPAALLLISSAPIADGSIASDKAKAIVAKDLLAFMDHQNFCVGNQV